ncbi:MAG: hypothetical protein IPP74_13245 [Alphaproteobacteria bacterium]|nr:hypothetical protein [Alphaproteobacteria bacterium]
MSKTKAVRLKKDLIIPAGTIFTPAATKTTRDSSFAQTTIGLTPDTFGEVVYEVWGDDNEKIAEWFEEV